MFHEAGQSGKGGPAEKTEFLPGSCLYGPAAFSGRGQFRP
ncbi:hypothetical protein SACS_1741 [Parasaccharibacter apium]|uniref:Uncharacterized protein n=1 Tax=Parasaccharibacter apium TaxID=1510841 RepID=A0A7U7G789_9PROT|nr:hypothetical protein SACS_1741 [Parasaccharibacter apium]